MPRTAKEWERVPGVGRYTAGAIASISAADPSPVVDGNVERVFARVAGDYSTGTALNRHAWKWADRELDRERPGEWNQALMELGATVCRPLRPECPRCPLEGRCFARQHYATDELPVRPPKSEIVQLRHVVWVPVFESQLGLRPVPDGPWWQGMWEFPRAEAVGEEEPPELRELVGPGLVERLGVVRHGVTKHRITIDASVVRGEAPSPRLRWLTKEELDDLPIPAPQRKVLALVVKSLRAPSLPDL